MSQNNSAFIELMRSVHDATMISSVSLQASSLAAGAVHVKSLSTPQTDDDSEDDFDDWYHEFDDVEFPEVLGMPPLQPDPPREKVVPKPVPMPIVIGFMIPKTLYVVWLTQQLAEAGKELSVIDYAIATGIDVAHDDPPSSAGPRNFIDICNELGIDTRSNNTLCHISVLSEAICRYFERADISVRGRDDITSMLQDKIKACINVGMLSLDESKVRAELTKLSMASSKLSKQSSDPGFVRSQLSNLALSMIKHKNVVPPGYKQMQTGQVEIPRSPSSFGLNKARSPKDKA
jgi:hypothetical protein